MRKKSKHSKKQRLEMKSRVRKSSYANSEIVHPLKQWRIEKLGNENGCYFIPLLPAKETI